MLGILLSQVGECINRIAWSWHAKLNVGGSKMKIVFNRKLDHTKPIMLMCEGLSFFQGVLRTHHKPYLIQLTAIIERIGDDQMSYMDRVKRAKVQSDLHRLSG